jgi:hypothetical protein
LLLLFGKKNIFPTWEGFLLLLFFTKDQKQRQTFSSAHVQSFPQLFFYFIFFKKKLSSVKYDFLGCGTYLTQARKEEEEKDD